MVWRSSAAREVVTHHQHSAGAGRRALTWVCLLAGLLASCQASRECEASRLELARTFETLRNTASSRKQVPETASLSKAEEEERIRVWTGIESDAELLRSSFETPQVTWPAADKARAAIAEKFKPLESSTEPMTRGFAVTLGEADKRLAAYRQSCR